MHDYNYSSIDLQYSMISFLALLSVSAFFIAIGALFQSLALSLLKLSVAALILALSFQILMEVDLIILPQSSLPRLLGSSKKG